MRKINEESLKEILKEHLLWLETRSLDEKKGKRANLSGVDLSGINLSGINLSGAYLSLADLSGTTLHRANLRETYLNGANLNGAYLREAHLNKADLTGANLSRAYLCEADLYKANLYGANLYEANLSGAILRKAYLNEAIGIHLACPEKGEFIGFKRAKDNRIVELLILEDSKRSSATGRKCRCDKAKVLSITSVDKTEYYESAISNRDRNFIYTVGEIVSVDNFDSNRWNECAPGIHFFITRQEAINY